MTNTENFDFDEEKSPSFLSLPRKLKDWKENLSSINKSIDIREFVFSNFSAMRDMDFFRSREANQCLVFLRKYFSI